ncbi:MAG: flagellar hook-length control protein FliK [Pseudomonadales bacterium]
MDIKPSIASGAAPPSSAAPPVTELPASLQQLPRGTLLTAVVESSKPVVPQPSNPQLATSQTANQPLQAQTTATRSFDVLLNISGNKVQTQSNAAFNPGQLLKVEITANSALRVIQVATQQNAQLNQPLAQIQQGLRQALPLQQNPGLLLNNLAPLFKLLDVTPAAQATTQIRALLSTIPDLKQLSNPSILKNSVGQSGIFLESKIKSLQSQIQQSLTNTTPGTAQRTTAETTQKTLQAIQNKLAQQNVGTTTSARTASQAPTVESNQTTPQNSTHTTRKVLQTLLQNNAQFSQQLEKLVGQDFKAQLLKLSAALIPLLSANSSNTAKPVETALLQRILQILPDTRGNQLTGAPSTGQTSLSLSNLPISTQLSQLLNPSLVPGQPQVQSQSPLQVSSGQTNNNTDLAISTVLRQIAATLAQVQTNQLQSLAGPRADTDGGLLLNSWNIEIPVFLEGQFKPIQLQINEERHPDSTSQQQGKMRVWKITLGFDFEELGEFFATLRIINTSVSATFWSDKPETLQRISGELQHLNKSLNRLGLNVEELECRRGKPTFRETRLDQQLVDIKT